MMGVRQLNVENREKNQLIAKPRRVNSYQKENYSQHNYEPDKTELIPLLRASSDIPDEESASSPSLDISKVVPVRVVPIKTIKIDNEELEQKNLVRSTDSVLRPRHINQTSDLKIPSSKVTSIQTPTILPPDSTTKSLVFVQVALFTVAALSMLALLGVEQQVVVSDDQFNSELHFSWGQVMESTESLRSSLFAQISGWKL